MKFIVPLFLISVAFAQADDSSTTTKEVRSSGPLQTDRPNFTEGAATVDPGRYQLEMGYVYRDNDDDDGKIRDTTGPQVLFRIGVVEDVELRVGWGGYSYIEDSRDVANDMFVGAKWIFAHQEGSMPTMGLLAELTLPTGSGESDVDPTIKFLWSYELDDMTELGGNIGIASITGDDDRFCEGSFSISMNRSLNEKTGVFIEYYSIFPDGDDEDDTHTINGGITYLVNDDFQLDAVIGFGLNDHADDVFVGVGASYRF